MIKNRNKMRVNQGKCSNRLSIVSTPIGNAEDITLRALSVLKEADLIACEDTRVTSKLLAIHQIHTPLISYHDHNAEQVRPRIIEALKQGQSIALVSDAGTPLISDPGYKLVRNCVEEGLHVVCVPGPCSVLAALTLSALPTHSFYFAGFAPAKSKARQVFFSDLLGVPGTLIFFESARRLSDSLTDMMTVFGNRQAVVARELTKKFEEIRKDQLQGLINFYATHGAPKGEIVVLLDAGGPQPRKDQDLDELLKIVLEQKSLRDAVELVATTTGVSRRRIYERALFVQAAADEPS
ncbi:MAG: 16S rRNA (cytidine(1402)-2'-O)-methyltransferase [Alphaproteobacteria bacterium]|nr:16S rRNA (cytidine(1402)-2'-O)-methyltransferase [Alphaproteobacteria bacterium]